MTNNYFILNDDHTLKEVKVEEWASYFQNADRAVQRTKVTDKISVSTVFLGLPDQLFETMIFGGAEDQYQAHHDTWDEAVAGHEAALEKLR